MRRRAPFTGNVDLDAAAALLAEPLRHQLAFGESRSGASMRGRGHAPHLVELLHRRFHEARVVHRRQLGQREGVPIHHLAAPDQEHLQLGAIPFPVEAEHVAGPCPRRRPSSGRSFSSASSFRLSRSRAASSKRSASASSRMRRVSEVESSVVRPSRKSRAASDVSRYSSTGTDRVHAGGDAAADLVLEAGARALPVELFAAVPDAEEPVHQAHAPAGQTRREIGTRVHRAVGAGAPDDVDPRVLLVHSEPGRAAGSCRSRSRML